MRKHGHHFASLDDYQLYSIDENQTHSGSGVSVTSRQYSPSKKKRLSFRRSKSSKSIERDSDNSLISSEGGGTASSYGSSTIMQKYRSKFDSNSKSYSMIKVGRKKDLPTNSPSHHLHAHLRIIAGAKVFSFNDSDYLAQQGKYGCQFCGSYA